MGGKHKKGQKKQIKRRESVDFDIMMMTEREGKEREYEHNNKRKAENMCLYKLSLVFYFAIHCVCMDQIGHYLTKNFPDLNFCSSLVAS